MTGGKKQLLDFLEDPSFREMVLNGKHVLFWKEWIKLNPDQKATYDLAVRVLLEINKDSEAWDSSTKAALLTKINQNRFNKSPGSAINRIPALRLIAMVTLLIGGILWWYTENYQSSGKTLTEQSAVDLEWIVKSNPPGQKSKLILPDGSNVTLNAASEISYSTDFAKRNREIHLKGEAYFEVVSDSLLAFEVFAGDLITRALGTSFNIKNYPEMSQRVQLTSGRVVVSQSNDLLEAIHLNPGQEVVMTAINNLKTQDFDIAKATLWKDGILHFNRATFPEVVSTLERWYGVNITTEYLPRKSLSVTAEFQRDYLENVLHSLSFTFDFNYSIENKNVTIQFNPKSL
ncbi:FecR family protein [Lunatibacter salilacus]|uniref:FecR family protein n=1 Tax=Lunatibacter salilacus TaxID=2483804 RepID=UPI00131C3885|nr:FecR family protein [Lunatibacter salilacus]